MRLPDSSCARVLTPFIDRAAAHRAIEAQRERPRTGPIPGARWHAVVVRVVVRRGSRRSRQAGTLGRRRISAAGGLRKLLLVQSPMRSLAGIDPRPRHRRCTERGSADGNGPAPFSDCAGGAVDVADDAEDA